MEYTEGEYYDYSEHENISYNFSYDDYQTICQKEDVRLFSKIFLPVVYGLSLVVGLAGNALVVAVYAYFKRLKTLMDTFMVHLAVADLLLLLTLPFWAAAAVQGWELGELLCKIVRASYTINFSCSMLLLACISLDRYFSLSPGLKETFLGKAFRRNQSIKLCLVVWTIVFLLGIPDLVLSTIKELPDGKVCMAVYPSTMAIQAKVSMEVLEVLLSFLVPLLIMLYCYSHVVRKLLDLPLENREKKWATIRVLIVVVGVFVVTQLPYNIVKFCRVLDLIHSLVSHCEMSKALDRAAQVTESLALTHCCLNPLLYGFLGASFRRNVLKLAKDISQRGRSTERQEQHEVEIPFNSHSQSQKTSTFSI
ncbi:atypical chemokine receptor 4 [Trichomycterus rosablanca]|uniref:atypical chemokine receptor 4 n=1 Tax=Trichomycterus rosablanca TaxID=2290929 RepID=UPI002F357E96